MAHLGSRKSNPKPGPFFSKRKLRICGQHYGTESNRFTGWWFQSLWKIWKSIGMTIPNIWKNKRCSKPPTRSRSSSFILREIAKKSFDFDFFAERYAYPAITDPTCGVFVCVFRFPIGYAVDLGHFGTMLGTFPAIFHQSETWPVSNSIRDL